MRWLILPLVALGLMACQDNGPTSMDWRYTVGSNADGIWHTKANFYREGKPVHGSSNGAAVALSERSLKEQDYRWDVGAGRSGVDQPVPDKVVIEWVSYHDKKRYGITLDLPKDMGAQMARRYRVRVGDKWQEEQRNNIALGLASGGYVEVFLRNPKVKPDILLARGLATEVVDPYDLRYPLAKQFEKRWESFDNSFSKIYQQYPTPSGMAWAPIMDAYRVAQPKTDTDPVN
ncbi:DUF2931 family protein [Aeromonas enteropelogenes]|uniref:DUF2931 family protein n=1 Tax=Aeromonas enteropelogenes TaxID=29489 RepID=UPI0038D16444